MTSGAAELIMVLPTDSLDTVSAKIRASGANAVQLLVADDTPAFQSTEALARIGQLAVRGGIALTVISSDERTLAAAQQAQLDVLGVNGARVAPQIGSSPSLANQKQPVPYETRYIPRAELEQPLSPEDANFLDDLDRVPDDDPYRRFDDALDPDLDDFDDGVSAPTPPRGKARLYDDDLDEEYDPRQRDDLDDDDIEDITPSRTGRRAASLPKSALAPTYRSRAPRYEDDVAPRRQRGGILLPVILGGMLALALVAAWLWSNRPVVYVWPAPSAVLSSAFAGEVIPVTNSATGDAVKAAPLATTAELTVQGRGSQQLSPAGTARGTVTIFNSFGNPIELPVGTQFIATNGTGQSVSFLIDSPATVPPAVTSTSIAGTSTQNGVIEVAVSARSPGSASNVDANTVTQLALPDGQNLQSGSSIFLQNQALQGGSEDQVYIVTEQDVRAVLGEGLTQLYRKGIESLQAQQAPEGFVLDQATVFPDPQALGDPVNYEPPAIAPALGQPVSDQANPVFTMTLRADFSALAAPPVLPPATGEPASSPVAAQLQTFVPNYLAQQRNGKLCETNEQPGVDVTRYVWNGQQLAVDGEITCTPPDALADATLAQIKQAIVGQPAESAEATLAQLLQNGTIGGYQLPRNVSAFPSFGFLLRVERAPDNSDPPQGAPPVPTSAPAAETAVPDTTAPAATSEAAP